MVVLVNFQDKAYSINYQLIVKSIVYIVLAKDFKVKLNIVYFQHNWFSGWFVPNTYILNILLRELFRIEIAKGYPGFQ